MGGKDMLALLNAHRVSRGLEALTAWAGTEDELRRELDRVENDYVGFRLHYTADYVEVEAAGDITRYPTDSAGQEQVVRHVAQCLGRLGTDPLVLRVLADTVREGIAINARD